MILRKAQKRTSKDVTKQVGCCEIVVNFWLKRYQEQGFEGLRGRSGEDAQQEARRCELLSSAVEGQFPAPTPRRSANSFLHVLLCHAAQLL